MRHFPPSLLHQPSFIILFHPLTCCAFPPHSQQHHQPLHVWNKRLGSSSSFFLLSTCTFLSSFLSSANPFHTRNFASFSTFALEGETLLHCIGQSLERTNGTVQYISASQPVYIHPYYDKMISNAVRLMSTFHGTTHAILKRGDMTKMDDVVRSTVFSPQHFPKFLGGTMIFSFFGGFFWMESIKKSRIPAAAAAVYNTTNNEWRSIEYPTGRTTTIHFSIAIKGPIATIGLGQSQITFIQCYNSIPVLTFQQSTQSSYLHAIMFCVSCCWVHIVVVMLHYCTVETCFVTTFFVDCLSSS